MKDSERLVQAVFVILSCSTQKVAGPTASPAVVPTRYAPLYAKYSSYAIFAVFHENPPRPSMHILAGNVNRFKLIGRCYWKWAGTISSGRGNRCIPGRNSNPLYGYVHFQQMKICVCITYMYVTQSRNSMGMNGTTPSKILSIPPVATIQSRRDSVHNFHNVTAMEECMYKCTSDEITATRLLVQGKSRQCESVAASVHKV